ncbi:MAG: hypothetical protein PHS02_00460 [Candidatus ainarchaeum sp.]|nr:hypothetical protein [Candidatus ainarchaeum sp.]
MLLVFVVKASNEGKKLADVELTLKEYGISNSSWAEFLHNNSTPGNDISVHFEIVLPNTAPSMQKLKLSADKSKLKEGQKLLYDFMRERLMASEFKDEAKDLF